MTDAAWTTTRKVVVAVIGGALVLVGAALMVLPGPGIPVLLAGVGVLAFEFESVRRWRDDQKNRFQRWRESRRDSDRGERP